MAIQRPLVSSIQPQVVYRAGQQHEPRTQIPLDNQYQYLHRARVSPVKSDSMHVGTPLNGSRADNRVSKHPGTSGCADAQSNNDLSHRAFDKRNQDISCCLSHSLVLHAAVVTGRKVRALQVAAITLSRRRTENPRKQCQAFKSAFYARMLIIFGIAEYIMLIKLDSYKISPLNFRLEYSGCLVKII
jgi:hypothetical protein